MNLTPIDIKRIADRIVLDDDYIVEEFSDISFLENVWNSPDDLKSFTDSIEGSFEFTDEPDPFDADQRGELDLNPEQNPDIVAAPEESNLFSDKVEETNSVTSDGVPSDAVPLRVSNYVNLVQQAMMPGISFEIFDCKESFPLLNFDISKQYLIKVLAEPNDTNKGKLSDFLHKPIQLGPDCLYWSFGESIPIIRRAHQDNEESHQKILSFRNSSTILAPWLDAFIYNKLEASYDPRYRRFAYNDDLTEEEARIYLGTYFPRSYGENFLIFENLFMHPGVRARIESKRHLSILSMGAGTGGDIVGLLTALDKFFPSNINVSITALDANNHSLSLQKAVIERYQSLVDRKSSVVQFNERIDDELSLSDFASNAIPDRSIDFLLIAKIGCELHGKKTFGESNVYEVLLEHLMPKVSNDGVLLALDVTTKVDGLEFMPIILNRGVNNFIDNNPDYSTLLPLSCHFFENDCNQPCFIQQEINVTHCKKYKDLSKICYRIIARKEYCETIIKNNKRRFITNPSKALSIPEDSICHFSRDCSELCDAYNLN